jgi:hypothetical protein
MAPKNGLNGNRPNQITGKKSNTMVPKKGLNGNRPNQNTGKQPNTMAPKNGLKGKQPNQNKVRNQPKTGTPSKSNASGRKVPASFPNWMPPSQNFGSFPMNGYRPMPPPFFPPFNPYAPMNNFGANNGPGARSPFFYNPETAWRRFAANRQNNQSQPAFQQPHPTEAEGEDEDEMPQFWNDEHEPSHNMEGLPNDHH